MDKMDVLFLIKEAGLVCLIIGYWIIAAKSHKKDIPLILFMVGTIAVLACLWAENDIIYNVLDPFVS